MDSKVDEFPRARKKEISTEENFMMMGGAVMPAAAYRGIKQQFPDREQWGLGKV